MSEIRIKKKAKTRKSNSNSNSNSDTNIPLSNRSFKQGERLTKGPNVLSWDCGISNLCYCLLELVYDENETDADEEENRNDEKKKNGPDDLPEFRIVFWENFSLNVSTMMQAINVLPVELEKRSWMANVDYVIIEGQIMKNNQMKVISHSIQMYFVMKGLSMSKAMKKEKILKNGSVITNLVEKGPTVHFIKANSKFQAFDVEIPQKIQKLGCRSRCKKKAIYMVKFILDHRGHYQSLRFLEEFKKQDDLCDSFLQGLYFFKLMKQKEKLRQTVNKYLGPGKNNNEPLIINIATKHEKHDETNGINEGCEYESEIQLPKVYRCDKSVYKGQ